MRPEDCRQIDAHPDQPTIARGCVWSVGTPSVDPAASLYSQNFTGKLFFEPRPLLLGNRSTKELSQWSMPDRDTWMFVPDLSQFLLNLIDKPANAADFAVNFGSGPEKPTKTTDSCARIHVQSGTKHLK
jgi:hypothetical protein